MRPSPPYLPSKPTARAATSDPRPDLGDDPQSPAGRDASAAGPAYTTGDLLTFSRRQIAAGSKSFAMAARLFPPEVRDSAYMLYAWCRYCDDVVDDQMLGFKRPAGPQDKATNDDRQPVQAGTNGAAASQPALARVAALEASTRAALRGREGDDRYLRPDGGWAKGDGRAAQDGPLGHDEADAALVFQALSVVCRRHDIPARYPMDLVAGFRMDAEGRHYDTIEDTLDYCYHVAGAVGVMMAYVMGARERAVLERACDLGIAFQLTNIARDVAADQAMGRVYLPARWLKDAGLQPETMCDPANQKVLFTVIARLLATAEPYYRSADAGLADLPWRSAWAVGAAQSVYRAIGLAILRQGPTALARRVGTSRWTKAGSLMIGLSRAVGSRVGGRPSDLDNQRQGLWTMPDPE